MKKRKVIFACQWNRKVNRTWSGTSYSIYQSLRKQFELSKFDIKESVFKKMKRNFFKILNINYCSDFNLHTIRNNNIRFQKKYKNESVEVFQFSECPKSLNSQNNIYIDLSISYLDFLRRENESLYQITEFEKIKIESFEKRLKEQNEFFLSCKNIFTMSQWLRDYLINIEHIDSNKVHYVGAGINVDLTKRNNKNKSRNKILFVGRNFSRKGGYLVYNAFRILRDDFKLELELHIAGPKKNPIKGNTDGVKFWGDITEEQMINLYNSCDILCVPSYFEAYGLVFSEALCFGLPCIGRNVYAMPERIEHGKTGYLIDGDEPLILANHIKNLFEDHAIFDEVEIKREYYQIEYSWDKVAERIAQYMNC